MSDPLVGRRQAVEMLCLDQPLVDYLVQNGVISRHQLEFIDATRATGPQPGRTSARRNLMVLECVDSAGRRGFDLFLNALRHTNQYELANMIDVGRRINRQSSQSMECRL